jgi:hypothetical protein
MDLDDHPTTGAVVPEGSARGNSRVTSRDAQPVRPLLYKQTENKTKHTGLPFFVPFVKFHALQAYKQNKIMGHGL